AATRRRRPGDTKAQPARAIRSPTRLPRRARARTDIARDTARPRGRRRVAARSCESRSTRAARPRTRRPHRDRGLQAARPAPPRPMSATEWSSQYTTRRPSAAGSGSWYGWAARTVPVRPGDDGFCTADANWLSAQRLVRAAPPPDLSDAAQCARTDLSGGPTVSSGLARRIAHAPISAIEAA